MRKLGILVVVLLLVVSLFGCSNNNQNTTNSQLLSSIKALDVNTLEVTFVDGNVVIITDFTPKPLEIGVETEVTFTYDGTIYKETVTYGEIFTGTIRQVNTGFAKNGSLTVTDNDLLYTQSLGSFSGDGNEFMYISGQDDNGDAYIKEVNNNTNEEKVVLFDGNSEPPAAYPSAFTIDGIRYLLFADGKTFSLYSYDTADENVSYFTSSDMWDFSNITDYLSTLYYNGEPTGWVMAPEFSVPLNTLYFTLGMWVDIPIFNKPGHVKVRLYKSELNNNVFSAPEELKGAIDPYNAMYYKDGKERTINDYPAGQGLFWLGRMYITDDASKAYFTLLTSANGVTEDIEFLNPGFPYAVYNSITDKKIYTIMLSADIDKSGEFYNVQQLPFGINRPGVNLVCDISPDGSRLYVAHMEISDTFLSDTGWGPDGMMLELCRENPWDVPPWDGVIEEVIF